MRLFLVFWNLCALAWACSNCNGRHTLLTDRSTTVGTWYNMEHCPQGMHVNGMSIKYLPNQGKGDNSALTGVRFFCNNPAYCKIFQTQKTIEFSDSCNENNIIYSGTAYGGAWQSNQWCPNGQFLVGFAFRQSWYDVKIDNLGIVNFAGFCGFPFGERTATRRIEGTSDFWGTWSTNKFCPVGYVLCGLQSRVHAWSAKGDNHGVTNYQVDCCEVSDIHCTPGHQILTLTKLDNSHELAYNVESLAYRINAEIANSGNHITSSSLRAMLQDAMGHGTTRTFNVQVPKRKQAVVKQVYLTCGAYRVALAHVIEEGTKKPGHGGGSDDDADDSSEDDC